MSLKWQSGSHLVVPGSNPSLTFSNFSCSRRPGVRENRGSHSFESLCVLRQVGVQASMRTAVLRTTCRQAFGKLNVKTVKYFSKICLQPDFPDFQKSARNQIFRIFKNLLATRFFGFKHTFFFAWDLLVK